MSEKWQKVPGHLTLGQDEVTYHVTDEVVVRRVQLTGLIQQKDRFQLRIDAINADIAKINELRATE